MKHNQNIKQALKKAMQTRDLTTAQCVVYVIQKDRAKVLVDSATPTAVLGGHEVCVCVCVGGGGGRGVSLLSYGG